MTMFLDETVCGRHVRIMRLDGDRPVWTVLVDGALYDGFTSQVAALAAARVLVAS